MPSAQRRERQKRARERAAAAQGASQGPVVTQASKSTQTELSPWMVRGVIEQYWRMLDARGWDTAAQPLQFIIGENSSARLLSSSMSVTSQALLPEQCEEEEREDEDAGAEYSDEFLAFYNEHYALLEYEQEEEEEEEAEEVDVQETDPISTQRQAVCSTLEMDTHDDTQYKDIPIAEYGVAVCALDSLD